MIKISWISGGRSKNNIRAISTNSLMFLNHLDGNVFYIKMASRPTILKNRKLFRQDNYCYYTWKIVFAIVLNVNVDFTTFSSALLNFCCWYWNKLSPLNWFYLNQRICLCVSIFALSKCCLRLINAQNRYVWLALMLQL